MVRLLPEPVRMPFRSVDPRELPPSPTVRAATSPPRPATAEAGVAAADGALVARAAAGEEDALAALLDRHCGPIERWLYRRGLSVDDAREVALGAFLPSRLRGFRGDAAVRTYLIAVARNVWREKMRDDRRGCAPGAPLGSLDALAAHGLEPLAPAARDPDVDAIDIPDLMATVATMLDPRERELFDRRYAKDQTFVTIAAALGLPGGAETARSIHRRALIRLRARLRYSGPDDQTPDP